MKLRNLKWSMLINRAYWKKALYLIPQMIKGSAVEFEGKIDENIQQIHALRPDRATGKVLRILYVASKYDYGDPKRGLSYEETNFYHCLKNMGHEIVKFDFMTIMQKYGAKVMNKMLLETAYWYNPDLMFCVTAYNDIIDKSVINEISTKTDIITFNWFTDDHWEFDSFSRYWAPMFNWVSTTATSALPKYKEIGYKNVIHTQWACNHFLYKKYDLPYLYDVTFVGQPYGNREGIIKRIKKSNIEVRTWGQGWKAGRLSQIDMIKVFNQSKINLSLSKAWKGNERQIKGKDFEVPGCGSFLITGGADNFDRYYEVGKEVVCYDSVDDLIDKVKYYLKHEAEREAIAKAGYERTLREHTYENRFNQIFETIGLV